MKRSLELVCAFGGVIFAVLFGIGFLGFAHFVPPLAPSHTAAETAEIFRTRTNMIRIGLLLCYIGCPFYLAFGASISARTRRIVGVPKTLIDLQVASFAAASLLLIGPFLIWQVAAFRPDAPIEIIQTLNDVGWMCFLLGWVPFVTWFMATGVAILCDTSATPIYPRWSGYLALTLGFAQTTASFLPFFKTGPFAWDGVFSWWAPAPEFFTIFVVMTVLTVRAVNNQYRSPTTPEMTGVTLPGHVELGSLDGTLERA
jgi:hypothetical protein